jgi:sulfofructose kinase
MIRAYPPPDVKCEFTNMHMQGGGPVANALVALSRWGLPCYISAVVGDDAFGKTIVDSLREEGIDTSGLVTRIGHISQFAFIVTEPDMARRTIFWQRPTGMPLQPDDLDLEVLLKSRALHTDGIFTEASIFACIRAKKAGIPVIVDAGTLRDGMLDIARLSDCFIASETFSRAMAEDPVETCLKLSGLGCRFVGVTLGAKGYIAMIDGRIVKKPAYQATVVDTTGCGDAFHAGVSYGIVQGLKAEKCLDLGAWAAASVSTQMGGRKGIPAYKELIERGY